MRFERTIKSLNGAKCVYSWLFSTVSGTPVVYGMPVAAGIELTSLCNLRCPECATGSGSLTRQSGFMDIKLFERIVSELNPYLYNMNLYFQGEPMLHPEFFRFTQKIPGIRTIVSTNGHFLSGENATKIARSGLDKLIVSLDGMDQSSYAQYRINGQVETVKQGIEDVARAIRETGSALRLEVQFLVNRHNESQIKAAEEFAGAAGARLRLKSMQIINGERVNDWMPSDEHYKRYRKKNGNYLIKTRLSNRCLRLWTNPVITWDGKVVPCCFDKDAGHIMGDLNFNSFREIWHGEKYRAFRESVLTGRKTIEICRNCTSGMRGVRF